MPSASACRNTDLPHDVLARICSFLPPGAAILTVPRLSKALAAAGAPRAAALRKVVAAVNATDEDDWRDPTDALKPFSAPLWALREAWPQLEEQQRKQAATRAAFHGDLATLRWALPQRRDHGAVYCLAAAAGGQLEALQYARAVGCAWEPEPSDWPWEVDAWVVAALNGRLAVLQWMRAQQSPCPWDEWTCRSAAGGGHLAVLQWARAQQPPCPWHEVTCSAAAGDGHLAVLQWARAQQPPCPWNEGTCLAAAEGGHLAVLQWARAQQPPCPWDEWTCQAAAGGGHLAVLQWMRAQDPPCPWDEWTCQAAAEGGHLAVLQWARAQQPPCPWGAQECFAAAATNGPTAEWIRAQAALEGVAL